MGIGGVMAVTPEGKVKYKLVKFLNSLEPRPYMFFPVPGGYGRSGIPDIVGCWKGRMFAIECKAPGKFGNTTTLQRRLKLTDLRQFLLRKEAPPVWGVEDLDEKRQRALKILGDRWVLHPNNAPKKGNYDGWPKK